MSMSCQRLIFTYFDTAHLMLCTKTSYPDFMRYGRHAVECRYRRRADDTELFDKLL